MDIHPIILTNRMGGLGNQLFQYAAARAVAHYQPDAKIIMEQEVNNLHNLKNYDYANILMRSSHEWNDGDIKKDMSMMEFEQKGAFMPWSPEQIGKAPIRLKGYFQYLPAILPILDDLLCDLKNALNPFLSGQMKVEEEKTIFMHVRRGDYLQLPDFHYIQTPMYYEEALKMWKQGYAHGDDYTLYLISDDLDWCRKQPWSFQHKIYDNEDELETLAFMSQCKAGAIIGNSTFSYWGALLSGTDKVFYPDKWIGENIHDLFPTNWTCVSNQSITF